MRTCTKCKEALDHSEFRVKYNSKGEKGLTTYCKQCLKESIKISMRKKAISNPTYTTYRAMINRCKVKTKYYGDKGISVCKQWDGAPDVFAEWAIANGFKKGLDLDRIDPEKGYSPKNCRFITHKENSQRAIGVLDRETVKKIRKLYHLKKLSTPIIKKLLNLKCRQGTILKAAKGITWSNERYLLPSDAANKTKAKGAKADFTVKLNRDVAERIRKRYARGGISKKELGLEYEVSPQAITHIIEGFSWN